MGTQGDGVEQASISAVICDVAIMLIYAYTAAIVVVVILTK